MANSRQSAKRARQGERRRMRNKAAVSRMRTILKKARLAANDAEAAKKDGAENVAVAAQSAVDAAAQKGLIHRNKAARIKSRLVKMQKRGQDGAGAAKAA